MKIELVDKINKSSNDIYSEDTYGYDEKSQHYWLIDGATHVGQHMVPNSISKNGDAYWYANLLSQTFKSTVQSGSVVFDNILVFQNYVFPKLLEAYKQATYKNPSELEGSALPSATALMVSIIGNQLHIFALGDCRYVVTQNGRIIHNLNESKNDTETAVSIKRQKEAEQNGLAFSLDTPEVKEKYKIERDHYNAFGKSTFFSLDDHSLINMKHHIIDIDENEPMDIMLMSDGLSRIYEVYSTHTTPSEIIEDAKNIGLDQMVANMRSFEDAADKSIARVKRKDDASALLLRIDP